MGAPFLHPKDKAEAPLSLTLSRLEESDHSTRWAALLGHNHLPCSLSGTRTNRPLALPPASSASQPHAAETPAQHTPGRKLAHDPMMPARLLGKGSPGNAATLRPHGWGHLPRSERQPVRPTPPAAGSPWNGATEGPLCLQSQTPNMPITYAPRNVERQQRKPGTAAALLLAGPGHNVPLFTFPFQPPDHDKGGASGLCPADL